MPSRSTRYLLKFQLGAAPVSAVSCRNSGLASLPLTELGATMVDAICESVAPQSGDRVLLLVNGMGGTPLMELYLMYHVAEKLCSGRGLKVARSLVGNYCTSLEMQGCSITAMIAS